MGTFLMLVYVIATIVTSSKVSTAFSINREETNARDLYSTTNSYSEWSVELSPEDDVKERLARDVNESMCVEPSEDDLSNQLHSKILSGDDVITDIIPEQQVVPLWEEITGMGVYVQNGREQLLAPSALLGIKINRRTLCPWERTPHTDSKRYPRTMYHARCLCIDCTDWSQPDHVSHISTCEPLTKQTIVLRRGECVNGTYSYDFALEPVIVACVCSRSSDQQASSNATR